jgi:hypothetical protein
MVIYQIQLFEHFETLVAYKWTYTCVDNRQVSVPRSKNCPTIKYHKTSSIIHEWKWEWNHSWKPTIIIHENYENFHSPYGNHPLINI